MGKIEVIVKAAMPDQVLTQSVDTLKLQMSENKENWEKMLEKASEDQIEVLECTSFGCSNTMSDNFQVIGTWLRMVYAFQMKHHYPETVRVLCHEAETAKTYKLIYNFYIAETKQSRLPDDAWD